MFYLQRLLSSGVMAAGAQLTELDLSDNVVGQNRIEGFADLLKSRSCFRLQTLKLNNNRLGVDGGKVGHECKSFCICIINAECTAVLKDCVSVDLVSLGSMRWQHFLGPPPGRLIL